MKRDGFALIELLLTIVVSSLLATALFTVIFQTNQLRQTVANITSIYSRASLLQSQLERDLMGAFIPAQVEMIQTATAKESKKGTPIEKVFEATAQGENLEMLTFITDNPLQTYLPIKGARPKPRAARVVYRLQKDKKRNDSYTLMRQEGEKLSFGAYGKQAKEAVQSFVMVEGIAQLSLTLIEQEVKKKGEGSSESKKHFKKVAKWTSSKKEEKKEKKISLPEYVQVTAALWDAQFDKKKKFVFTIPIVNARSWQQKKKAVQPPKESIPKQEPSKKEEPKKEMVFNAKKGAINLTEQLKGALAT